jgi:hypothetical protein
MRRSAGYNRVHIKPVIGRWDLGFFRDVGHPLLRERGSGDIKSKVLHGLLVTGSNPGAAMDVESARGSAMLQKCQYPGKDAK